MSNEKKFTPVLFAKILKNKKVRIGFVLFIIAYTVIFIGTSFNVNIDFLDTKTVIFKIIPGLAAVIGLGYVIYGYLEGNKLVENQESELLDNIPNSNIINKEIRRYVDELRHMQEKYRYETRDLIEQIRKDLTHQNELHLDEKQREEIFNSLKKSFTDNINEEFYKQLNENISIDVTQEKRSRLDLIISDFNSIKKRLNNEVEKLSRKANLNLVIGSLTTMAALIALWFFVFQADVEFKGFTDMLYHYVPRLSLIIFIEVFAYFFLRLYKLNLNDMKYFQNELTSVELKLSSITTAINFGKETDISEITQELSKTERNFILRKDETTVELEKSKINNSEIKDILKSIIELVNKKS